jgi:hypothetical protein
MRLKRILLLYLVVLLFGCSEEKVATSFDLTQDDPMSVFDMFSDVSLIRLETTAESMIRDIWKVIYHNSHYYVLDRMSQQVFCFDEKGRFEFKISAQGKGPGEYHNINSIGVDSYNDRLILLDPVMQRVLLFDLNGNFIETHSIPTEMTMGYLQVFALNDSILLLTSITNEQLVFYSTTEKKVVHKDFPGRHKRGIGAFSPVFNAIQFNRQTYVLPTLSQELFDVTEINPEPYFSWDFGAHNNSRQQVGQFLDDNEISPPYTLSLVSHAEAVGEGRALNHHIIGVYETDRFRIAFLEFSDDFKHLVYDKHAGKQHVFVNFREGIILPYENVQQDRAIAQYTYRYRYTEEIIKSRQTVFPNSPDSHYTRNRRTYTPELLSEEDREYIANYDPMHENPYLVVYKFKK